MNHQSPSIFAGTHVLDVRNKHLLSGEIVASLILRKMSWTKQSIECNPNNTNSTWSPRTGCSVASLQNGSFLIFGGASHEQGPTDEAWIMNINESAGSKDKTTESNINYNFCLDHVPKDESSWPRARYDHGSVRVRVLDGTDFVNSQEKIRGDSNEPEIRWKQAVLILGGAGSEGLLDDIWFFDAGKK